MRIVTRPGKKPIREVIDGQQRIRSIFDFIDGAFRIPRSVSADWGGRTFEQLSDTEQERLSLFSFNVYQYKQLNDFEVLDMFARLNTYSVGLSTQELRNGKWFGQFKRLSYRLAGQSLEFWRKHRIFNEQNIARMREVELVSELLVAQLDGMQDKKNSLDTFYDELDETWGNTPIKWEVVRRGHWHTQPAQYASSKTTGARFYTGPGHHR